MTKIYKAYNLLRYETHKYLIRIGILWLFSFFILVVMDVLGILPYFGYFYLGFVCLMSAYFGKRVKINLIGLEGERKALRLLKSIPPDYVVFSNVTLYYDGKESETDLIVVGPKGVFLIEVKNHNGIIMGKPNDKKWVQFKETAKGGKYANPFYNPTKQVKTHVYRLAGILKDAGYPYWVQGIVYFVNPNCDVKARSRQIPVLSSKKTFAEFLEDYEPRREVTKSERKLIIEALKKQIELEKRRIKLGGLI